MIVRPDETAFSLSDILEIRLENARKEGHLTGSYPMPKLCSDNGSGFTSKLLAEYLSQHRIKHIFGTPYHPSGGGARSVSSAKEFPLRAQ
jgi:transposase InsO family protein